ncbi:MAG: AAA family ATPase, partial [Planctomycetes bacterium]|nr:AAA family ATPase [Planctomycetota bacterium]
MEERPEFGEVRDTIESVLSEVAKVYVGQTDFVRLTL